MISARLDRSTPSPAVVPGVWEQKAKISMLPSLWVLFEWFVRSGLWCWGGLWSVVFGPIWLFPVCCPHGISTGLVGNRFNSFFFSRSFMKKTTGDCQQWVPHGEAVCLLFCGVAGLEIGWCGNKLRQPVEVLCVEFSVFPEWFACGQ